ncbi:MAG TPA: glycoside hydrolase family 3 N-terminal domain-containing protein, partial [Spirochaetota bacterium]|nr:glycoside hydrolase family 3 N-terminal domain-containing protein [Spirochaetota bacterium]
MKIKPMTAVSLLLVLVQLIGCKQPKDYITAGKIASGLANDVLLGQMLIIALPSGVVDDKTIAIIKKYKPGGVIIFGYNLTDGSCKTFCNDLQNIAMEHIGIPLFIAIDQEGGRVKRIQNGVTQFPGNFALGVINNPSKVYRMAQIVG